MINLNSTSRYRLYSETQGVIGPPGLDSDNIIGLDARPDSKVVKWKFAGLQNVDCFDAQIQEFVKHRISWDVHVENEWFNLLNNIPLSRSSDPNLILLTGLPGSGKTTLAKNICSKMGWLHFDFADFAHKVIGEPPLMVDDYVMVGRYIEKKLSKAIGIGISIVYDTTSPSPQIRQHIIDAIDLPNKSTIVYVPTEPETCLKRVSLRKQPPDSRDLRLGIYRSNKEHLRTINDFINDYEAPRTDECVLAHNEADVDDILKWLIDYSG